MPHSAPPLSAVRLLNQFAGEPGHSEMVVDLGRQFEGWSRYGGRITADRWYWREVSRKAARYTMREMVRTPARVLALTVPICLAINGAFLAGSLLFRDIQWAWIPPHFWRLYQVACLLLTGMLITRLGVAASRFLKRRELS